MLANNHVLDWGEAGLVETLSTIEDAGIAIAGAGTSSQEAERPAVLASPAGGRVLVFSWACRSSGVPGGWAAGIERAGVNLLPHLSSATAQAVTEKVTKLMVPFRIRNFRLNRASREDAEWLTGVLDRECGKFGAGVRRTDAGELVLEWTGELG